MMTTEAQIYLNIVYFCVANGNSCYTMEMWEMSCKSIFVLLFDGQSAVCTIYLSQGIILERNGLHVETSHKALKE